MMAQFINLACDLYAADLLPGELQDCFNTQCFAYYFEDNLPVCVRYLAAPECLAIESCIESIYNFPAVAHQLYVEAMMRFNAITMHGQAFSLQLDSTDTVILSRRVSLAGLGPEQLYAEIDYVRQQSLAVRRALRMSIGYPDFEDEGESQVISLDSRV